MEILSSGSFVNLENQGKIEQLIYTAREIAVAAVGTDGFTSGEENNRRLALEIWQGAEYMTRDHEEAQVKNIFINNFLDRLRELGGAPETAIIEPENSVNILEEKSPDENVASRDEFLGFIGTAEVSEQDNTEQAPFADEDALEAANGDVAAPVSSIDTNSQDEKVGAKSAEPDNSLNEATLETENAEPEKDEPQETNQPSESGETENTQVEANPKQNVGAIILPEKEPYQFDKCTVTATIQLLPTTDFDSATAKRKAVLSVRTHDFAPQFAVVELSGADGDSMLSELLPALRESLEKYKTDLPLKVMDKMKKEKSAPKKQTNKTTGATKPGAADGSAAESQSRTSKTQTEKTAVNPENTKPATAKTGAPKPAAVVPAASVQQGSLFNF